MMADLFTNEFFADNRRKLRQLLGTDDPIVVAANGLVQRNADITYQFRQDSNFWYLTGIDEADIILVMSKTEDYLILPPRSTVQNVFDGTITSKTLTTNSGIKTVLDSKDGWKKLSAGLAKSKSVATIKPMPTYIKQLGFYTNPAKNKLIKNLKTAVPGVKFTDIKKQLIAMRQIKQSVEINALQAAVDVSIGAFEQVKSKLSRFDYEYQIESAIDGFLKFNGLSPAYESIVASGKNACTLHYISNNQVIKKDELLLIDAGAEANHYSADITRTYALTKPTKRQTEIHDAVKEVQAFALSILKPGITIKDYETKVEKFMGLKLKVLKLITTLSHKKIRQYYPHSTSHFLGLDTHDAGDYSQPLEANMVLTVEPGIYLPKEKIGIRIEDDVLITQTGNKVLSDHLDKSLW